MSKKKKKKASKAVRTPGKPISINIFLDGRCASPLREIEKAFDEAMTDVGKNPLNY